MNNLSDHLTGPKLRQQQMLNYAYIPPPIFPQVKPNALVSTVKMNVYVCVEGGHWILHCSSSQCLLTESCLSAFQHYSLADTLEWVAKSSQLGKREQGLLP